MQIPSPINRLQSLMLLVLGATLLMLSGQHSAQAPYHTHSLLQEGSRLWAGGYYDSAFALFRQARRMAQAEGRDSLLAQALRQCGKYYARHGFPEQAAAAQDSAIAMADKLGPLHPDILLARGERADVEAAFGNMEAYLTQYQQLEKDCQQLPPAQDSVRAMVNQWVGQAYAGTGDYPNALKYCHKALAIFSRCFSPDHLQTGYAANALGVIYSYDDQNEASMRYLSQALSVFRQRLRPDHSHLVQVRGNLAVLYRDQGLPWKALAMFRENLNLLDNISPAAQYSTLYNMAVSSVVAGDYEAALPYLDRAEALLKERPGLRPDGLGLIYFERSAALQSLGDYEKALYFIEKTIERDTEVYGRDDAQHIMDYLRKGDILGLMGQHDAAITAMQKALQLAGQHWQPHALRTGYILEALAQEYLHKTQPLNALDLFRRAQQVYRHSDAKWNFSESFAGMAAAWRLLDKPDSVFACHRSAWNYALPDIPFEEKPGPAVYACWNRYPVAALLEAQGASFEWQYKRTQQTDALQNALQCYRAWLAVSDSQRYYYAAAGSKQLRAAQQRDIVEKALALCDTLYRLSGEAHYLHLAFELAENSKSRLLRDQLRSEQALRFAGIPDSLLAREADYREQLAALHKPQDEDGLSPEQAEAQQARLFALQHKSRAFLAKLAREYPVYYRLQYPDANFSAGRMLAALPADQAAYSYFLGKKRHYAFRLYRQQLALFSLPDSLTQAVGAWQEFCASPPDAAAGAIVHAAENAARLGQALLPDLPGGAQRLLLLPDGVLGSLSFESLLLAPAPGPDFRQWDFLARNKSTAYASSAALWLQQLNDRREARASYAGFAPDFTNHAAGRSDRFGRLSGRSALAPLQHNMPEVIQAAKHLRGKAYTGAEASETQLKNLDDSYTILHLATHALPGVRNPMQAKLVLASDSAQREDGELYAWELYGQRLNSPLALLSACHAANGPLLQGEGIMSLARAFQYAGVRRVIATLWLADDRSGAFIAGRLVEQIAAGERVEKSLQNARLDWLGQADSYHAHPYYWAGFVLNGHDAKIRLAGKGYVWLWMAGFVVLLGAGIGLARRWKKSG